MAKTPRLNPYSLREVPWDLSLTSHPKDGYIIMIDHMSRLYIQNNRNHNLSPLSFLVGSKRHLIFTDYRLSTAVTISDMNTILTELNLYGIFYNNCICFIIDELYSY